MAKLLISREQQSKLSYLLNRFKSLEWSGPAWYSYDRNEQGFPDVIRLVYFHPLHLGTGSATEWQSEDLMKVLNQIFTDHPEVEDCFQGNVHSHNTMGAFFSTTDVATLKEHGESMRQDAFYFSLVVSKPTTAGKKEFVFAMSYEDQYGQVHVYTDIPVDIEENGETEPEWVTQADLIEKRKQAAWQATAAQHTIKGHLGSGRPVGYSSNQGTIWEDMEGDDGMLDPTGGGNMSEPKTLADIMAAHTANIPEADDDALDNAIEEALSAFLQDKSIRTIKSIVMTQQATMDPMYYGFCVQIMTDYADLLEDLHAETITLAEVCQTMSDWYDIEIRLQDAQQDAHNYTLETQDWKEVKRICQEYSPIS